MIAGSYQSYKDCINNMPGKQKQDDNFANDIAKHWPIFLFMIGMAVTWGVFSNRITNDESRLNKLESNQEATAQTLVDIETNLATINANIEFIKQKVQ